MSSYNPHKIIFILSIVFFGLILLINNFNFADLNSLAFLQEPQSAPISTSTTNQKQTIPGPGQANALENSQLQIPPPSTSAISALMYDLSRRNIIYAKSAQAVLPIASLTKLMTAVIAQESYSNKDIFTVGKNDLQVYGKAGELQEGEKFSLNQLLNIMLVSSSNRAAYVLARHMGLINFVDKMNEKAKTLGMKNTYYVDPSGLGIANQSTAKDLVILADYVLQNHFEFFKITQQPSALITSLDGISHYLLSTDEIVNKVPNLIGGKTGLTDEARGCLLIVFEKGQNKVAVVVLGSNDRFADALNLINWVNAN